MFLPTTRQEMNQLGWDCLDVILVTGDSYIDSPYIGSAVIGKVLAQAGYKVGIIAQPEIDSERDICRLGEPTLFWGVTGGSVDSMVANYTALKKRRKSDDYTPGGVNNRRPDRAVIVYSNVIRRFFKHTKPIVLGGIEASLRRIAHYDYWSDRIRGSVLFDAKADYLLYGMAEKSVLEMVATLAAGSHPIELVQNVRGLCYLSKESREGYLELPAYETVTEDKNALIDMFHIFYQNNDPLTARGLYQKHRDRYLIQNPPSSNLTQPELDAIYDLNYKRAQHPYYEKQGKVTALATIQFSISTHRGCYGECNFCAIAVHEGRTVRWRSPDSILAEARELTQHPDFKGYILDAGGPTANMYGFECKKKLERGNCVNKRCTFPEICPLLKIDHQTQVRLLKQLRRVPGVKKVYIASGIRYDLVLADETSGKEYLDEVLEHHVSGQMKVAPEHTEERVLNFMGKPGKALLEKFKAQFDQISRQAGKQQFLTYYLIAAHPGCSERDMLDLKRFTNRKLKINPEQVQIFTPTPSTYSSLMYYTEMDPFTRLPIFVEKDLRGKARQKDILTEKAAHRASKAR
jgi:uncharacterized radical SAM protein YgiQ